MTRSLLVIAGLAVATAVAAVLAVAFGTVSVPLSDTARVLVGLDPVDPRWTVVIETVRLPRAATAALVGAALGVAGLQTQTLFGNPLADPFSLGVSSGAGLGVALTFTGAGLTGGLAAAGRVGVVAAASLGAAIVLVAVLAFARIVRSPVTLLVIGVMIGSAVSAVVSLTLAWSDPQRAQRFVVWGLGSFSATSEADLPVFAAVTAVGLLGAVVVAKPLNALLIGEEYARTLGLNVRRARIIILVSASLLAGVVTAFCGPIGFLGIAVPHVARRLVGTSDHRVLVPAALLTGVVIALLCVIASQVPGSVIPVNVITSLIGAPVVIAVLVRGRALRGVEA